MQGAKIARIKHRGEFGVSGNSVRASTIGDDGFSYALVRTQENGTVSLIRHTSCLCQ
jgi:hypothetical protein